jgi:hypothetical protein
MRAKNMAVAMNSIAEASALFRSRKNLLTNPGISRYLGQFGPLKPGLLVRVENQAQIVASSGCVAMPRRNRHF